MPQDGGIRLDSLASKLVQGRFFYDSEHFPGSRLLSPVRYNRLLSTGTNLWVVKSLRRVCLDVRYRLACMASERSFRGRVSALARQ